MAYTLNRGWQTEGFDRTQLGLLIGLPVLALLISFGAWRHNPGSSSTDNAKVIPLVSEIKSAAATSTDGSADGSGSSNQNSADSNSLTLGIAPGSTSMSVYPGVTSGSSSSQGTVQGTTGGRGGGPSVSSTPSSGGLLPLNNNVVVPPVNIQAGGKPVVSGSGTTLYVN
jgi:hypothetical protein